MTKTCRRLILPLLAVAIAACSSDQTGPGSDSLTGSYVGVSADGFALPHTFQSGVTLTSYTITTRSNQTYDLAFSKTHADGSPSDVSDSGTYSYDAASGAISFTGQIPGTLHATVTDGGNTMTLSATDVGYTVVLKR